MFNIEHTPRTFNYPIAPYLSIDPLGFPMLDEDGFFGDRGNLGWLLAAGGWRWGLSTGLAAGNGVPR